VYVFSQFPKATGVEPAAISGICVTMWTGLPASIKSGCPPGACDHNGLPVASDSLHDRCKAKFEGFSFRA
jgi:hypothetical protein